MKLKRLLPLLLLLLLAACGGEEPLATPPVVTVPPPATEAAVAPTATDLPAPPTAAAVVVDTQDPTATPLADAPTATPSPTETPSPTPTPLPQAPSSVRLEAVVGGFVRPLLVTHAGDQRLFVVEQPGRIYIVVDGVVNQTPFLNIANRVTTLGNEQGLLGLAFSPDYATNGEFYVNYSRGSDGATVVARYRVSADNRDVADPASEEILLTISQPYSNHNGGGIAFGPNGNLYIGMGDGGSQGDPQGHAQNLGTLLGAILRINVDGGTPYAIPADNPFVDDDSARNEIWAYGFRNPWRFSFDRLTGDLFIADVGQNEWEEVSMEPAGSGGGLNYGWNLYEGTHCYGGGCDPAGLVPPVAEYSHFEGGCSITGGYVYRGGSQPALFGNYFFADYCTGNIWSLTPQADGSWLRTLVAQQPGLLFSSFGEDAAGELYLIEQGTGTIYRLLQ